MSNTIASLRWKIGGVGDLPFVVRARKAPAASSDEMPLNEALDLGELVGKMGAKVLGIPTERMPGADGTGCHLPAL